MRALALCLCLFGGLFAVYGLSYSGAFTADDEHLFIAGAQSFARAGQFDTAQAYGNSRMQTGWRDVEPLHPALGAALVRAADSLGLGRVHTPLFLNSLVTALTAVVVCLTARVRGFEWPAALGTALLFGLGTMAWPNAKTFFRDPLAALLLSLSYLGFELAPTRRAAGWALCLAGLLGGLLTKSIAAAAVIVFSIAALSRSGRSVWGLLNRRTGAAAAAAGAAAIVISALLPSTGPFNRLSLRYLLSLAEIMLNTPHAGFAEAMVGPLVSPGKSLFLYCPPLLLALAAFVLGPNRRASLAPWLMLGGFITVQALFYDSAWWGNAAWGLRYLLPVVPLLSVSAAPLVQRLWEGGWAGRAGLLAFGAAAALIQLPGVLINARNYFAEIYALDPARATALLVWEPAASALVGQWQLLLAGRGIDPALSRVASPLTIIVWLSLLGLSLYGAHGALLGKRVGLQLSALAALCVAAPVQMLWALRPDPLYFAHRTAFADSVAFVARSARPGDVLWLQAYGDPLWHYVMNNERLSMPWASLPIHYPSEAELAGAAADPAGAIDPATLRLADSLGPQACRLWLLNAPDSYPRSLEVERAWLRTRFGEAAARTFADAEGAVTVSLFQLRAGCSQP